MCKKMLVGFVVCVLMAGCATKQMIKHEQAAAPKPQATQEQDASARDGNWQSVEELKTIHFQYDSAVLQPEVKEILEKNAEYLNGTSNHILVEGHCDQRGTVEYNLALGERRAAAVKQYYVYLGIPLKRIAVISYGKEKPVDSGNNETAWAKNRRAETKISVSKVSSSSGIRE